MAGYRKSFVDRLEEVFFMCLFAYLSVMAALVAVGVVVLVCEGPR